MPNVPALHEAEQLTQDISAAMVKLYGEVYGRGDTTAETYINGDVVVCILQDILTSSEQTLVASGAGQQVIDGRVAFQAEREDAFTAAVERITMRTVVAFLSANQTSPGIASEMFFLEPATAPR